MFYYNFLKFEGSYVNKHISNELIFLNKKISSDNYCQFKKKFLDNSTIINEFRIVLNFHFQRFSINRKKKNIKRT
jgi:hypothetical protein